MLQTFVWVYHGDNFTLRQYTRRHKKIPQINYVLNFSIYVGEICSITYNCLYSQVNKIHFFT